MRHEKAARLLELARRLAASAEGLTLDEMSAVMQVSRRTVERMRDAVREAFPQMEEIADPPTVRFRIPSGLDGIFQAPTAEEFAALRAAAEHYRQSGATARAAALSALESKVLSAIRAGVRRRLAPDMEALLEAETMAVHPGPRPFEDEAVLGAVREAIVSLQRLRFLYDGGSTPGREREVTPYGLLFGRSNYLVAAESGSSPGEPRNWRLDRIRDVRVVDTISVKSYSHQSQAEARVTKSPQAELMGDGTGILVIDDLVDTGRTLELVRRLYPKAHFATVYAKPSGRPMVDSYITEVSQDTWIFFPWDMALQYVQPFRGKD